MNFIFEYQKQYLTSEQSELVRYCFCHEYIKFISSSQRVMARNNVIDIHAREGMETGCYLVWALRAVYFPLCPSCLYNNQKYFALQSTFHYISSYWRDKNEFNLPGGETGFDFQQTKLPTYWNTPFSKICLGMKINQQINFTVINRQANSLYSLIADGRYRNTTLSRDTWKTLIGSDASLQLNCNLQGFNAACNLLASRARIGFVGNDDPDCGDCDSRIGFGTGGTPDGSNTCGNVAQSSADNGDINIKAMGYILVQ